MEEVKTWITTPNEYDLEEARIVAWFTTGLRREAIRLTKKYKRWREHELLVLNEQLKKDAESRDVGEMMDTLISNSDTPDEAAERIFLREAFSLLTPHQKKVIVGTILEEATEQKISQEMGITHQAVHKLKERGLNRLRKRFVPDKPHRQVESNPGRTTTLTQR